MNAFASVSKTILNPACREPILSLIQPRFPRMFSPSAMVEVIHDQATDSYTATVSDPETAQYACVTSEGIYMEVGAR